MKKWNEPKLELLGVENTKEDMLFLGEKGHGPEKCDRPGCPGGHKQTVECATAHKGTHCGKSGCSFWTNGDCSANWCGVCGGPKVGIS